MAKRISKTAIMKVLGIVTDKKDIRFDTNCFYYNDVKPVEVIKFDYRNDWNDDNNLETRGFAQMGNFQRFQAPKGSYTVSAYGNVGYWARTYTFYYNKDTDQVAIMYRYLNQWAPGVTGSSRSKEIQIFSGDTFR